MWWLQDTDEEVVRGYIVVGSLMAVGGLASLILRETKGQGLQDSLSVVKVNDQENGKVNAGFENDGSVKQTGMHVPVATIQASENKESLKQPADINNWSEKL